MSNHFVVQSDTRTLLHALSKTFTRSTVALSELLQNARRARATSVEITVSDTDICITDDGCGIADFGVLLALAQSGWDATVQASDAPYGMGWFSVLFGCERVEVRSLGRCMEANTADLLALSPVEIGSVEADGRTHIRLIGHRLGATAKVCDKLTQLVAGFPLPVAVNGELLPRPHALEAREFIETEIGFATPGVRDGRTVKHFYLQGLPISTSDWRRHYRGTYESEIVHLASPMFEGRMPERDCLIEPEKNAERIRNVLDDVARAHLAVKLPEMGEVAFLARYGTLAAQLGLHDLLNGIGHVPGDWVAEYDSAPRRYSSHGDEGPVSSDRPVSREELLARGLFDIDTERESWETDLLAAHAVHALKGFSNMRVPQWHWAAQLVQPLGPADCQLVTGAVLGEDSIEVYGGSIVLRLVETLQVCRKDAPETLLPVEAYYDEPENVLYATKETTASDGVRQVTNFEDGDDHYQEQEEGDAMDRFDATRMVLLNREPSGLLLAFLRKGLPWRVPEALRGRAFTVELDGEGKPTVVTV